jgi:hypothetical protein
MPTTPARMADSMNFMMAYSRNDSACSLLCGWTVYAGEKSPRVTTVPRRLPHLAKYSMIQLATQDFPRYRRKKKTTGLPDM